MLYDATEITKRYVFGTPNPSPFPFYTDHIRPFGAIPDAVNYDMFTYMTQGSGRYAYPSLFPIIKQFFDKPEVIPDSTALPGGFYSYFGIVNELGLQPDGIDNYLAISQYGTDIYSNDHFDRSYIFGSTGFFVKKAGIEFHVDNGVRWIENMETVADEDGFDYESDNPVAQFAALYLKPKLDPYALRREQLPITYSGSGKPYGYYGYLNYLQDKQNALISTVSVKGTVDGAARDIDGGARLLLTSTPAIDNIATDTFLSYVRDGRKVVYGTPNDDVVVLDSAASNPPNPLQLLIAGAGDDSLIGNGSDQLYGHTGDDVLLVSEAPASGFTLDSPGNNTLSGGAGDDTYRPFNSTDTVFEFPNDGTDLIIVTNNETFDYFLNTTNRANVEFVTNLDRSKWAADGTNNVIDVATLNAENVNPINMALEVYSVGGNDTIIGANGNDTLNGGNGNDSLLGNGGDDLIIGGTGFNTLNGGAGNDTITSEAGIGTLYGDDGDDVLTILAIGDAKGNLFGGIGNDTLNGGNKFDSLNGGNDNDVINGGGGGDIVNGDDGNDTVSGDAGNDTVRGGNGRDSIYGGDGNDSLFGDSGNDALFGSAGNDTLFGGTGTNNLQGFNPAFPSATEVDTLFYSGGAFTRFFLAEGGVNGYKQGGDNDYALIQNFTPGFSSLVVANTLTTGRVLVGGDIYVYDNSIGSELIAKVIGINIPSSVTLTTSVSPLP